MAVEFHDGLRVTTDEAMEVVKMVLVGKVNTELVAAINVARPARRRASRATTATWCARQKRDPRLGRVGEVTRDRHDGHRQPHRGRLHPGRRHGRGGRRRRQLQRQRRPRRRRARRGARGRQGHLPHRRRRAVPRLRGQGLAHQRADARRGRGDDRRGHARGRHDPQGRGVRARAARRACARAHILNGTVPHALLLEVYTDEGVGTMIADADGEEAVDGRRRSRAAVAARRGSCVMQTYARKPVLFVRGEGMRLYDDDGRGVPRLRLGHRRGQPGPRAPGGHRGAVPSRRRKLVHVSNLFYVEHRAELARDVVELARRRLEGVLRQLRRRGRTRVRSSSRAAGRGEHKPGAYKVVTLERSFHGRTLAALAATGQAEQAGGVRAAARGLRARARSTTSPRSRRPSTHGRRACCSRPCRARAASGRCSAEYLAAARSSCADERGCLLILDEVQTGFFRTGPAFAHQAYGVKPDVMTWPRRSPTACRSAALVARDEVAAALKPGDHGSTFGGGPVDRAPPARATLAALEAERPRRRTPSRSGDYLQRGPDGAGRGTRARSPTCAAPGSWSRSRSRAPLAAEVGAQALDRGLVLNAIGTDILRFLPPLVCGNSREIDTLLSTLSDILAEAEPSDMAMTRSEGRDLLSLGDLSPGTRLARCLSTRSSAQKRAWARGDAQHAARAARRSRSSSRSRRCARASPSSSPCTGSARTRSCMGGNDGAFSRAETVDDTAKVLERYVRRDRDAHLRAVDARGDRRGRRGPGRSTRSPTTTTPARGWPTCSPSRSTRARSRASRIAYVGDGNNMAQHATCSAARSRACTVASPCPGLRAARGRRRRRRSAIAERDRRHASRSTATRRGRSPAPTSSSPTRGRRWARRTSMPSVWRSSSRYRVDRPLMDARRRRRDLPALPARAPRRRGHRRGHRRAAARSSSTRPRTACTPRRRCSRSSRLAAIMDRDETRDAEATASDRRRSAASCARARAHAARPRRASQGARLPCTQATVSRDITEMGLRKLPEGSTSSPRTCTCSAWSATSWTTCIARTSSCS